MIMMSVEKKFNNKVYLIIAIIFFIIGAFIAGFQGRSLVNGVTQFISGSLGIICLLKYFYKGKK